MFGRCAQGLTIEAIDGSFKMELRTTFVQSNLSIATIEGNSEKGRIRQGIFI
jgi:hypothetical protein